MRDVSTHEPVVPYSPRRTVSLSSVRSLEILQYVRNTVVGSDGVVLLIYIIYEGYVAINAKWSCRTDLGLNVSGKCHSLTKISIGDSCLHRNRRDQLGVFLCVRLYVQWQAETALQTGQRLAQTTLLGVEQMVVIRAVAPRPSHLRFTSSMFWSSSAGLLQNLPGHNMTTKERWKNECERNLSGVVSNSSRTKMASICSCPASVSKEACKCINCFSLHSQGEEISLPLVCLNGLRWMNLKNVKKNKYQINGRRFTIVLRGVCETRRTALCLTLGQVVHVRHRGPADSTMHRASSRREVVWQNACKWKIRTGLKSEKDLDRQWSALLSRQVPTKESWMYVVFCGGRALERGTMRSTRSGTEFLVLIYAYFHRYIKLRFVSWGVAQDSGQPSKAVKHVVSYEWNCVGWVRNKQCIVFDC